MASGRFVRDPQGNSDQTLVESNQAADQQAHAANTAVGI